MGWKSLVGGFVIGVVTGGALILSRQPKATDTDIVLPNKSFNVSAYPSDTAAIIGAHDQLDFSGTITGKGIGNPNNVFHAICVKQDGKCRVASIDQIGSKHMGDLDLDEWDITEWSADYVVARNDNPETTSLCSVATFHANLHTQEIVYTTEPVIRNTANEKLCPPKFVDGRTYRWTIEAPTFWREIGRST